MLSFVDDKAVDSISLHLFHNVENGVEIRSTAFKSGLPICLLRPQCVWDPFQLSVAITKALQNQNDKTMKTRAFGTEILYWLSPSNNISESLKTFGFSDTDKELLVICSESDFARVKDTVKGQEIPLDRLHDLKNKDKIFDIYGIKELGVEYHDNTTLVDYIVSKVMTKEFA